jgi:UDP-N-acetylmuramoyl-L-alanyl-D-glutamate--2,6-diaminopimelate ligase
MDLAVLMDGLPIRLLAGPRSVRVTDLTEDSRSVLPGSLFVARRGLKHDGRAFVAGAVGAGASAVLTDDPDLPLARTPAPGVALLLADDLPLAQAQLAERFYGSPSARLMLCGATGTNGKTTITYLIHQLLNRAGIRCGLIGTVCVDDGVETAPAHLTTPPAMELSRTMHRMVEAGCRACAMETSSHSLDQQRVGALRYRVGVFTNLSHDHLDYHGTMDAYALAKARLFAMLPAEGTAIVNADDEHAPVMLAGCRARRITCSQVSPQADVYARAGACTTSSTVVRVRAPWTDGEATILLPLVGAHNVMNAVQAATAAWAMGMDAPSIVAGLAHVHAPPGRLEPITPVGAPVQAYVDYAHSDDSLRRVLGVLREALRRAASSTASHPARLVCVFGCGGDRDRTKRPKMGAAAAELADVSIVTSDNPRTEQPGAIIDQILAGVPADRRDTVTVHADRARAIHAAAAILQPGDVLLIAGKGHEDYQILPDPSSPGGTRRIHFDDRQVGREALGALGWPVSRAPLSAFTPSAMSPSP